jgi:hypothetical protein
MGWEYMFERLSGLVAWPLNDHGSNGWEAVAMTLEPGQRFPLTILFKRALPTPLDTDNG